MRGRGSKPDRRGAYRPAQVSSPVRGRGSKPRGKDPAGGKHRVVPRAGTWIETRCWAVGSAVRRCRPPCGDVDRNFSSLHQRRNSSPSSPVRGRGSKPQSTADVMATARVVPRAGTWIETPPEDRVAQRSLCRPPCGDVDRNLTAHGVGFGPRTSSPVRGRGSKRHCLGRCRDRPRSSPVRGRGSKHLGRRQGHLLFPVVPRAGTWIETCGRATSRWSVRVVPRAGTWIETISGGVATCTAIVVPHAGTWIETRSTGTPCRSRSVVPHAGTWIETFRPAHRPVSDRVVPHAGTWIETS